MTKRKDTIARLPISKLLMEFPEIQIPRQKTLDQSFLELVVTNDYPEYRIHLQGFVLGFDLNKDNITQF